MKRFLAFYKVDNSLNYERHTFDSLFDEPGKIREMLDKLPDEEYLIYDLNVNKNRTGEFVDISDFIEDYNDEILDGGWWSVLIEYPD